VILGHRQLLHQSATSFPNFGINGEIVPEVCQAIAEALKGNIQVRNCVFVQSKLFSTLNQWVGTMKQNI
jgi:hypothetical protein